MRDVEEGNSELPLQLEDEIEDADPDRHVGHRDRLITLGSTANARAIDDLEMSAIVTPPLTTVRQPLAEMGRIAVSLLVRILDGQRLEALHIELKTRLIVRQSTARVPEI